MKENPKTEQIWHGEGPKPLKSGGSPSLKHTPPSACLEQLPPCETPQNNLFSLV